MAILRRRLLSIPVCCLSFLLVIANTGCGGGSPSVPPAKKLTSISVAPSSASIAVGATQQFTATAAYSDGSTANVSSTASWTVVSSVSSDYKFKWHGNRSNRGLDDDECVAERHQRESVAYRDGER